MLSLISAWVTTLSLVFGGCCANALTLEQLTSTYPNFGSLITLLQFILISLHGLPTHLTWTRYGPRFKPRRIPLTPYLAQVALFYFISLLNNAAFAYRIPMPVHIIFRSGGLIVSMLLGWIISKKRYNTIQIVSVLLVTLGVGLTTLSASQPSLSKSSSTQTISDPYTYATGIAILSLALFFSGFLGLLQDWTYSKYGRPSATAPPHSASSSASPSKAKASSSSPAATWQESMFYLHFLALPLFLPLLPEVRSQLSTINYHSPRAEFSLPLPPIISSLSAFLPSSISDTPSLLPPYRLPSIDYLVPYVFKNNSFVYIVSNPTTSTIIPSTPTPPSDATRSANTPTLHKLLLTLSLPKPYLPLLLNTLTQLLCVAGVHRLTTRVTALTVTLVLVVRKAVSLVISLKGKLLVDNIAGKCRARLAKADGRGLNMAGEALKTLFGIDEGVGGKIEKPVQVDETMLWTGAAMVLLGTVGYTIGTSLGKAKSNLNVSKGKTE